jgi:FkbM family methyltransferase
MPRRTTTADVVARCLGTHSALVVDLGSRFDAHLAWFRLSPLARLAGFEPDRAECDRLNRHALPGSGERHVHGLLGALDGSISMHVGQKPELQSPTAPLAPVIERFPALADWRTSRTYEAPVRRLDTWARAENLDEVSLLHLDARGGELAALRGLGALADQILAVEVEVYFTPVFESQPLFAEVDAFLRARGLVLWRLGGQRHVCERHYPRMVRGDEAWYNGTVSRSMVGSGRLISARALYLRDPRLLGPGEIRRLLVMAAIGDAAGEMDVHVSCLQRALLAPRALLDDNARQQLSAHLRVVEREV